ncbi:MAG: hypothetical protein ACK55Z_21320, partial [bacterium]
HYPRCIWANQLNVFKSFGILVNLGKIKISLSTEAIMGLLGRNREFEPATSSLIFLEMSLFWLVNLSKRKW